MSLQSLTLVSEFFYLRGMSHLLFLPHLIGHRFFIDSWCLVESLQPPKSDGGPVHFIGIIRGMWVRGDLQEQKPSKAAVSAKQTLHRRQLTEAGTLEEAQQVGR